MLKLKKIKLVLRCLCLLWGESGKPTDLLFLGKTPCPELPTHLPGLKICICSDIHWKILPDILLALVSVMERRVSDWNPSGLNLSHEWILNNLLGFHLPFYPVSGDASQKWLQGRGWRQLWQGTRKVSSLCFNNINRKCLYISHWIKKGNIIHSFLESFLFVHKYICFNYGSVRFSVSGENQEQNLYHLQTLFTESRICSL